MLHDSKYNFDYHFDKETGFYYRSGVLDQFGNDTGEDPFMSSFPHLIDVGIMGHCTHGISGQGARYSCYISIEMIMTPCSFDRDEHYGVDLRQHSIQEAWDSEAFNKFRNKLRTACPNCEKRSICMGGCPLTSKVTLCRNHHN